MYNVILDSGVTVMQLQNEWMIKFSWTATPSAVNSFAQGGPHRYLSCHSSDFGSMIHFYYIVQRVRERERL